MFDWTLGQTWSSPLVFACYDSRMERETSHLPAAYSLALLLSVPTGFVLMLLSPWEESWITFLIAFAPSLVVALVAFWAQRRPK